MSRIVVDNNAHRRTLGANTLEQVVGKTDFDFFPRELAAQFDAEEKQVVQSGEPLIDKLEKSQSNMEVDDQGAAARSAREYYGNCGF